MRNYPFCEVQMFTELHKSIFFRNEFRFLKLRLEKVPGLPYPGPMTSIRFQPYCQLPRGKWVRWDFLSLTLLYWATLHSSLVSAAAKHEKLMRRTLSSHNSPPHLNPICIRSRSFRGGRGQITFFSLNGQEKRVKGKLLFVETIRYK